MICFIFIVVMQRAFTRFSSVQRSYVFSKSFFRKKHNLVATQVVFALLAVLAQQYISPEALPLHQLDCCCFTYYYYY